jgi:hypothetical protein
MQRQRIERKMREIGNWEHVKFLCDDIEETIGKMLYHRLDYTGNLKHTVEQLEEYFSDLEDKALDALIAEEDSELEEKFLPSVFDMSNEITKC